ncbi:MAG TPA: hypothetical protein ENI23_03325 [bacterium]|nr:hypothetical protein [bacterium]
MTDNNQKTTSVKEQVDNKAVEPVDKNAPLSLKEAEAVVNAKEGEIEEAIEKTKLEKDTEIAPDLIELKKEQTEKKKLEKEVKQKEVEVKKEVKTEKKISSPSKFENKTPEEKMKIYKEMESSFTQKSQKVAELETKVKELEIVDKKIEDLKKDSVIRQQKDVKVKLPEYPKDDLYYEDPVKYNRQVKEYNDAQLNARINPLLGANWATKEDKIIADLKENTKSDLVTFEEVEKEVQSRVRRNPAVVNQLGLGASQYFYAQVRNEMLPQKIEDLKTNAKDEAKRELEEENKETSEEQIMSSDITTQSRESKTVDLNEVLVKEGPEKAIETYKKKYRIDRDI